MRTYFYLFIFALSVNSCVKIETKRAPSEFAPLPPVKAPVYTTPACNPLSGQTEDNVNGNFSSSFQGTPKIQVKDKKLTFLIENQNGDALDIVIFPFVEEQSTVYTFTGSKSNIKEYNTYVEVRIDDFFYGIIPAKSIASTTNKLHLRYDAPTRNYQLVFCGNPFSWQDPSTAVYQRTYISGKFIFKL